MGERKALSKLALHCNPNLADTVGFSQGGKNLNAQMSGSEQQIHIHVVIEMSFFCLFKEPLI